MIGEREYAVRPTRRPSEELQTGQPLDVVVQQVGFQIDYMPYSPELWIIHNLIQLLELRT